MQEWVVKIYTGALFLATQCVWFSQKSDVCEMAFFKVKCETEEMEKDQIDYNYL